MPDRPDPPEHDDEPGELAESDERAGRQPAGRADGPDEPAEPDELAESDVGSAESDEPDEKRPSADEPAWRARLRRSGFGQIAVVLVTSFAIAIAAWWVVKPSTAEIFAASFLRISSAGVALKMLRFSMPPVRK